MEHIQTRGGAIAREPGTLYPRRKLGALIASIALLVATGISRLFGRCYRGTPRRTCRNDSATPRERRTRKNFVASAGRISDPFRTATAKNAKTPGCENSAKRTASRERLGSGQMPVPMFTFTSKGGSSKSSLAIRAGILIRKLITPTTQNLSRSFGFAAVAIWLFTASGAKAQADAWTHSDDSISARIECANGFPEATLQTFAYKESGYDAEAWRFEIAYSDKTGSYYQKIRTRAYAFCKARGFNGRPSVDTEIAQRGISWGMFQILGDNLRECGLKKPFMSTLTRSESFEYFAKFFAPIWNKRRNFHLACVEYNGGAAAVTRGRGYYAKAKYNPWEYADRMVQIRAQFSR